MVRHKSKVLENKMTRVFTRIYVEEALREQGFRCCYCLSPLTYRNVTRDHKRPRADGGLDRRDNILASCEPCNVLKGVTAYGEFMRLITVPRAGEPIAYRLVWSSRRINARLDLMERRLSAALGRRK